MSNVNSEMTVQNRTKNRVVASDDSHDDDVQLTGSRHVVYSFVSSNVRVMFWNVCFSCASRCF